MIYAFIAMFLAIPIMSVIWWITNLIDFCKAKKNSETTPEEMKSLKSNLIISSVVAFVLAGVVGGTIITFAMGIVYM
jgi:hypothetical protein